MQLRAVDFLDRLPDTRRPRLWLAVLCLLLYLPGFFTIPPGDRDESRFAQATRQMVESGDYVRIRLGEEERNKKPAGIHWTQAAMVHGLEATGLGDRTDIWAYRLPSLLGALLAVLATFHWGRALVGRRAAFTGAAMLAGCLVLVVETHIAKTDAALLATIAAAMGLFGHAYLRPERLTAPQAGGFWLALGAGILLKGPIAPMVSLLAGVTLAVMDRGRAPWLKALCPAWGLPLMLAAAAPWFVAIGIATEGRFFQEAVGGDMLSKVGSGEESHWGPPGYYAAIFGITAFPAAWIVLRAIPATWADRLQPPVRFLLAWAVPTWLVFEAVATKLPHYTLPAFPALMLLGARWAMDPLRRAPPRPLAWLSMAVMAAVPIGLALAALVLPWVLETRLDSFALLAMAAAVFLVWRLSALARAGAWGRAALAGSLLAVPLYAAVLQGVLPRLEPIWLAPRVAAAVQRAVPGLPAERFGIAGYHEPSLLFATGAETRLLGDGAAAAEFLAGEAEGSPRLVAVADRQEAAFHRAAQARDLPVREVAIVTGFNYSRGRWVTLLLFRTDRPAPDAATGE